MILRTTVLATLLVTAGLSHSALADSAPTEKQKKAFAKMDSDKNGLLTITEFTAPPKKGKTLSEKAVKKKKKRFKKLDSNKNKSVSAKEFYAFKPKAKKKK